MEVENYRAERDWLKAYVEYSTAIEIGLAAQESMTREGIGLAEICYVLMNGIVIWADRDYAGCQFTVRGRNCDEEEIMVRGRFENAAQWVAVDRVEKIRSEK
jgi:hypothetical protein